MEKFLITIFNGKEKQLKKHHPWVFTGAIKSVEGDKGIASWATVVTESGEFIAHGWYDERSHIVLHLLSWDKDEEVGEGFIGSLVAAAIKRRIAYFGLKDTDTFRLIHGEADFLPGIAVDKYGKEIRVIISSRFAEANLKIILSEINRILTGIKCIQVSTDPIYAKSEGLTESVRYFDQNGERLDREAIEREDVRFFESGIIFDMPHGQGQKSGFYTDQRDNRNIVESYANGKTVLDCCSYTGAFTLHALRGGAKSVDAIDSSETALRHLLYLVNINQGVTIPENCRERVTIKSVDCFEHMRAIEKNKYDLMILDPPKLAKTKGQLENAQKAYKDLNRVAMEKIKSNGIIATFSCSSAMTRELFKMTLAWAATDARVEIQILETLSAGSDHPIRLSFPESEYLKGYIIRVIK